MYVGVKREECRRLLCGLGTLAAQPYPAAPGSVYGSCASSLCMERLKGVRTTSAQVHLHGGGWISEKMKRFFKKIKRDRRRRHTSATSLIYKRAKKEGCWYCYCQDWHVIYTGRLGGSCSCSCSSSWQHPGHSFSMLHQTHFLMTTPAQSYCPRQYSPIQSAASASQFSCSAQSSRRSPCKPGSSSSISQHQP